MSKGRISLPTTLIPAAANREAASTEVEHVDVDPREVEHVAVIGKEPGLDGGGPPIPFVVQVAETSEVVPTAARQGSES